MCRHSGRVTVPHRALTPVRVLAAVVAGAAVLLALSQFADYRGVSIGTDAYAEVATVAVYKTDEVNPTRLLNDN